MNFLQGVQRLRQECGIGGSGPTAVANQSGELKRLVDWYADTWNEIQLRRRDWRWMRSSFTFTTTANDDTYAPSDCTDTRVGGTISRFSHWWHDDEEWPFRIYLQSDGVATERWMVPLSLQTFRRLYRTGAQSAGYPVHCAIDEQNNILLGPKPDGVYVVSGDYQMGPQTLSQDSDTPEMPAQYHMLIVYEAMWKYGMYESAPEVVSRARGPEYRMLLARLEREQLPPIRYGCALA